MIVSPPSGDNRGFLLPITIGHKGARVGWPAWSAATGCFPPLNGICLPSRGGLTQAVSVAAAARAKCVRSHLDRGRVDLSVGQRRRHRSPVGNLAGRDRANDAGDRARDRRPSCRTHSHPFAVNRYRCLLLCGLSGIVRSSRPDFRTGNKCALRECSRWPDPSCCIRSSHDCGVWHNGRRRAASAVTYESKCRHTRVDDLNVVVIHGHTDRTAGDGVVAMAEGVGDQFPGCAWRVSEAGRNCDSSVPALHATLYHALQPT